MAPGTVAETTSYALDKIGHWLETEMRKRILTKGIAPPDSDTTVRKKGFDWPLYETGLLVTNIKHRVVKAGAP